MKVIATEGEMFRRGLGRPKRIVVIGMWFIFGPLFLFAVAGSILGFVFGAPGMILIFSPILLLYGAILYRVHRRYSLYKKELALEEEREQHTDV